MTPGQPQKNGAVFVPIVVALVVGVYLAGALNLVAPESKERKPHPEGLSAIPQTRSIQCLQPKNQPIAARITPEAKR